MGQSVADLPDPLDQIAPEPLTATTPAGVDDLLAQMAGDEVDRLLAEAEIPRESPTDPVETPAVTIPAPIVPEAIAEASPPHTPEDPKIPADDLESATSTAERSGLEMPAEPVAAEVPAFSEAETGVHEELDARLPWYLKPLEWINAPMQSLPEGVREAVGKMGLLTLLNALAVLIYVFVFRKRH